MTFVGRMIGAAKLDPHAYEDVEADRTATLQALAVVALAALATGVARGDEGFAVMRVLQSILMWIVWAGLSYAVGVYLLPEPQTNADFGQMLRTIGFAASPGILRFFRFVPFVGPILSWIVGAWIVAAMVIAIQQALDYHSVGRAVLVCLISWFVAIVMGVVFGAILRISAGGLFY